MPEAANNPASMRAWSTICSAAYLLIAYGVLGEASVRSVCGMRSTPSKIAALVAWNMRGRIDDLVATVVRPSMIAATASTLIRCVNSGNR